MTKASRRRLTIIGIFVLAAAAAPAFSQELTPATALDKQLARIDFGVQANGVFTTNTSGTTPTGQTDFLTPTSTIGFIASIRYIRSPFVGLEFNYEHARYDQDFTYTNVSPTGTLNAFLSVQNNVTEYTFGYVVSAPKTYYTVQPFASVGTGTVAFRPSKGGGEGNTPQGRAAYYYNVGAQAPLYGEHFGIRAGFRQVFTLAPDFQQTYLRQHQRQVTTEPTIGFYIKF